MRVNYERFFLPEKKHMAVKIAIQNHFTELTNRIRILFPEWKYIELGLQVLLFFIKLDPPLLLEF